MVLKLAEKIFVIVVLLFYSRAFADSIPDHHPLFFIRQMTPHLAFIVTLLLIARDWQKVAAAVLREKVLWVLLVFVGLSPLWSDLPVDSFSRVLALVRVTTFGIYFATRFNLRQQMQLLACLFGLAAFLSTVFALALPQYGVVGQGFIANTQDLVHRGVWRGIYVHKNTLGTIMAMGSLTFLYCAIDCPQWRWFLWAGVAACVAILMMSTTKGALVVLMICLVLVPFYRALRLTSNVAVPFFILTILIGGAALSVLVVNAEQTLSAIGRDLTLTGRTNYWPLMIAEIWERPWLGYGYKAFWEGGWNGEAADVWRSLVAGDEPPHAHNGFLNLAFDVGFVGLSLFAASFITNCIRAMDWMKRTKTIEGFVPLVYLTFFALLNLTESYLVEPEIYWVLYVAITISMYRKMSA